MVTVKDGKKGSCSAQSGPFFFRSYHRLPPFSDLATFIRPCVTCYEKRDHWGFFVKIECLACIDNSVLRTMVQVS